VTETETPTTDRVTDETAAENSLFRSIAEWAARSAFAFAGVLALAVIVAIRRLSVPLAETTYQLEFPYLSFPVSLVPTWVAPVSLRPEAIWGMKPSYLVVTVGLWLLAVLTVVTAAGLFWWSLDRESGAVPPLSSMGWLVGYGVGAVVLTVFGGDLAVDSLPANLAGLEWAWTLVLALIAGRLFVAPVSIVLDGRRPLDAIHWSVRSLGGLRWTVRTTGLVLVLAYARRVVTAPFGVFGGGLVGLGATVVVGTALVGSVHAYAMLFVYNLVGDGRTVDS